MIKNLFSFEEAKTVGESLAIDWSKFNLNNSG